MIPADDSLSDPADDSGGEPLNEKPYSLSSILLQHRQNRNNFLLI
jgi:hypothetical protein